MAGLSLIEIIYWVFTIIGGTLFVLRTLMMFVGGHFSDDALDAALDAGDVSSDHSTDGDASFKLLSLQGLTSFFMMFGLVGLALLRTNLPAMVSVIGGTAAGLASFWVLSLIFAQMKRLQSEGTIHVQNAVGAEGSVYLTIPKNGTGQVQIVTQGALKIFDAISKDKLLLATGDKIRVVSVDGNTLVVEKVK